MSDALRDAMAALKPFARAWGLITGQPQLTERLSLAQLNGLCANELAGNDFRNAAKAYEALRANSSDVSVPREAWELWVAECQKPQFFTQTSGGGKASVEFTYHGDGALKRAQAMHSALTAIALAAGSASPQAKGEGDG
jgi:hypothetical protein